MAGRRRRSRTTPGQVIKAVIAALARQLKKRPAPAWLIVLMDVALIGIALLIFALFHHVIPREQVAEGTVSSRVSSGNYVPAAVSVTPAPTPAAEYTPAPAEGDMTQPEYTPEPTAEPTPVVTPDPVGFFGTKFAGMFTDGNVVRGDNSYQSGNVNITLSFHDIDGVQFYVADIYVKDISCLRTVLGSDKYGKGYSESVSSMSERNSALIAINGDYYGARSDGVVIRNGVLYREDKSTRDHLLIDKDGNFSIVYKRDYEPGQGQAWIDSGVVQSLVFGPALVDGGKLVELPEKYSISTKDTQREPRVAIGQVDVNHYVFVIADGRRTDWSDKGMTLQELQQVCLEAGCRVAFNLDGGGSATMILEGQRVNMGSTSRERDVSDIVYIGR